MIHEDEIQALIAEAEPLRGLEEDDPARDVLGRIVDEINRLRALQAKAQKLADEVEFAEVVESVSPAKRGPGRPKKVTQ